MRFQIYDQSGRLISETVAPLSEAKASRIAMVKADCGTAILAAVPEYKQRNLGMGLLSDSEGAEIRATITALRNRCDELEAIINAAKSVDELDHISF